MFELDGERANSAAQQTGNQPCDVVGHKPADPDGAEPDTPPEDANFPHAGSVVIIRWPGVVCGQGDDTRDPEQGSDEEDGDDLADQFIGNGQTEEVGRLRKP